MLDDLASAELGFAADTRYSRFQRRPTPIGWWDYQGGRWMISGYAELLAAAGDEATFSSRHDLGDDVFTGVMVPPTPFRMLPNEADPPTARAFRRPMAAWFGPERLESYRGRVAEFADWCLDRRIEDGAIDLFHDLAKLVPAMTVLDILGLPIEGAAAVADAAGDRDTEGAADLRQCLSARLTQVLPQRRAAPGDDLLSHLLRTQIDGRPPTEQEIVDIGLGLVVNGITTTARLTLGGLSYFAVAPEHRESTRSDPAFLARAIEEFLRYYSPLPFVARTAVHDVTTGGQEILQGDPVVLGLAAANRDPDVFDRPDHIVLGRDPNPHVAFGHGPHACLGAALGRLQAEVMIGQVLHRLPDFAAVAEESDGLLYLTPPPNRRTRSPRAAADLSWPRRTAIGLPVRFPPGKPSGRHYDFEPGG